MRLKIKTEGREHRLLLLHRNILLTIIFRKKTYKLKLKTMKKIIFFALFLLIFLSGYSREEDTTVIAIPDPRLGIVKIISPEVIDSVEIFHFVSDKPIYKTKVVDNTADLSPVERGYYYIVFITETRKRLLQKLFFVEAEDFLNPD